METIYNNYKNRGLEIVQIMHEDANQNPADVNDLLNWIQTYGLTYKLVTDPNRSVVDDYNVNAFPTNLVIGKDFIIKYRAEGFNREEIVNIIKNNI